MPTDMEIDTGKLFGSPQKLKWSNGWLNKLKLSIGSRPANKPVFLGVTHLYLASYCISYSYLTTHRTRYLYRCSDV